jgi:colanic acid/amylovoran biosynthesis glycosyltransferase
VPAIAYLANLYPAAVEPYVNDEINELQCRGITVIPCSVRRSREISEERSVAVAAETISLEPLRLWMLLRALWLTIRNFAAIKPLLVRALHPTSPSERRCRALLHTLLGAYYALLIEKSEVEHIHVHHGYGASWIAMVAAALLEIDFSVSLHGSDLLLDAAYLDEKLRRCQFCRTVSEFNRRYIMEHYPEIDSRKIVVRRIGVNSMPLVVRPSLFSPGRPSMLAVGRLHPVKNHAFLLRACHLLKKKGIQFTCLIAGDGPERQRLASTIRDLNLENQVQLLGHVHHAALHSYYESADLVVLTSRSEGIPLVLMEAMVRGKIVLAPAITGIPELIHDGKTGFLYQEGSLSDFVSRVEFIYQEIRNLEGLRRAAHRHVLDNFDRQKNLAAVYELFLSRVSLLHQHRSDRATEALTCAYPVLQ